MSAGAEGQGDPVVKSRPAGPVHLPKSGDTGFGFHQAPAVPDVVRFNCIVDGRPRPDYRHLPPQNVPELGNLVEAGATHEPADPGDTRIVCQLEDAPTITVGGVRLCAPGDELSHIFPCNFWACTPIHRSKLYKFQWDLQLTNPRL